MGHGGEASNHCARRASLPRRCCLSIWSGSIPSARRAMSRKARKHAVIIARIGLRAIPRDARDVEGPEYRAERAAMRERSSAR